MSASVIGFAALPIKATLGLPATRFAPRQRNEAADVNEMPMMMIARRDELPARGFADANAELPDAPSAACAHDDEATLNASSASYGSSRSRA